MHPWPPAPAVAFVNLVCLGAYQLALPQSRLRTWAAWVLLTGTQSLLVTALGLQVRASWCACAPKPACLAPVDALRCG